MPTVTKSGVTCENCGTVLGTLEDAFVWLDRPVCKGCFRQLRKSKGWRYSIYWMYVAIGAIAISIGLLTSLLVVLSRATKLAINSHAQILAPDNITVSSATYGDNDRTVDATTKVAALLRSNPSFIVTNSYFGDPALGDPHKKLTVHIPIGPQELALTAADGKI